MTSDQRLDTDPIRVAVGVSIKRARIAVGMSMRDFAARCGLSQPFVSAVERGLSTPSIASLYRMAEVLGTEPSTLLPSRRDGGVEVIRSGEGDLVPSSDREGSAVGRVLLADPARHLEIYEYVITAEEDLDVWYEHPGDVVMVDRRDPGPAGRDDPRERRGSEEHVGELALRDPA